MVYTNIHKDLYLKRLSSQTIVFFLINLLKVNCFDHEQDDEYQMIFNAKDLNKNRLQLFAQSSALKNNDSSCLRLHFRR